VKLRLHTRLTLAFGALLVALAAALTLWITDIAEHYHAEVSQRLNAGIAMYVTSELALLDESGINRSALDELANRVMTVNPSADVYLLAPDGAVIASLKPEEHIARSRIRLGPIRQFLQDPDDRPLFGDDPSDAGRSEVFSVAPVTRDGHLLGYLYVVLGGERFDSVVAAVRSNYSLKLGLLVGGAVLVATFLTGGLLFRLLTLPLRRLAARMRDWTTRTLSGSDPATVTAMDEIALLETQFEAMASRIEAQIEELKQADALRRELVANVSHDLRTPLASLRGYLETVLLKDASLPPATRREYLEIAGRHAQHLERLIAVLFELSKLESGAVVPTLEPFPLGELLQDVALRFRLRAQQAGVTLLADVPPDAPLALGDLALVERVLENLLDNALRHTAEGGRISLALHIAAGHLRVSVSDTGTGVAPEDLPRVFDRYFRGGERGERHRGGLGLAIVRRIVELHGESISLHSTPGIGTSVEFGLPVADSPAIAESQPRPKVVARQVS
jgi:two-component system OmpR family sensor kinase